MAAPMSRSVSCRVSAELRGESRISAPALVNPDAHKACRNKDDRPGVIRVDANVYIVTLVKSHSAEQFGGDGDLARTLVDRVRVPGIHLPNLLEVLDLAK